MRLALRILGLVVIALISAAAMLLQFPSMKEGYSLEEIPFFAAGGFGLIAIGVAWWWGSGKNFGWAVPAWIVLAPPALSALVVSWQFMQARFDSETATAAARVTAYQESFITWPGFDGPVGIRVAFEVSVPEWAAGLVYPPEVRMGRALDIPLEDLASTVTSGSGYFKDRYIDAKVGQLTLLKTVLFDRSVPPGSNHPTLERGGAARLRFDLHPGIIASVDGSAKICLADDAVGLPDCAEGRDPRSGCIRKRRRRAPRPIYTDGADLSVLSFVAGRHDLRIDLSRELTRALRETSRLQGDPAAWTAMQRRLEPPGLARAGYGLCPPGPHSHTGYRVCYCRP